MIDRGFEYTIPPFMMRGNIVKGKQDGIK